MRINIVTIFPEYFESPLSVSLVGKAIEDGHIEVMIHDLREHGKGIHRQVDDAPYGGGAGMVMMVEPLAKALEPLADTHKVFFTPAGAPLTQSTLDRLATIDEITLVCGRYEGVDERVVEHLIDEEISLGDFVLLGGEVAAAAVIEGIARLLPGVIGNPASIENESFRGEGLEEPQYTRPAEFNGWRVPDVLLSGDHAAVDEWRARQRRERTRARRPDLDNGTTADG
ncbi:MAG: tRNA (guanosine(37)-N1)-methyltransferase TrmD [Actinomycetota bacterium]